MFCSKFALSLSWSCFFVNSSTKLLTRSSTLFVYFLMIVLQHCITVAPYQTFFKCRVALASPTIVEILNCTLHVIQSRCYKGFSLFNMVKQYSGRVSHLFLPAIWSLPTLTNLSSSLPLVNSVQRLWPSVANKYCLAQSNKGIQPPRRRQGEVK
jgi:hypothetical protein